MKWKFYKKSKKIYNEDGQIVEFTDYRNNKPVKVYSYEYGEDSTIETLKDLLS